VVDLLGLVSVPALVHHMVDMVLDMVDMVDNLLSADLVLLLVLGPVPRLLGMVLYSLVTKVF